MALQKSTPKFVQGLPKLRESARGIMTFGVLSSSGNASLTLFNKATATNMSLATDRKIILRTSPQQPSATIPAEYIDFDTGLTVSGSGTGWAFSYGWRARE